jgi:hypothetical protein
VEVGPGKIWGIDVMGLVLITHMRAGPTLSSMQGEEQQTAEGELSDKIKKMA